MGSSAGPIRPETVMRCLRDYWRRLVCLGLVLTSLGGCHTHAGTGVVIGSGAGTVVGGIAGNQVGGHWKEGAAIGAATGATIGFLIGNEKDRAKAREW
jgi:uncharacterized protein YcfJ